jgi:hypothetical protein
MWGIIWNTHFAAVVIKVYHKFVTILEEHCISFVLGYLRMILWKMSTTIYLYGFLNQSLGLILGNIFFY